MTMPKIVIESNWSEVIARVTVVEISSDDGVYGLSCSGDGLDECPPVGFEPGDTWGNGTTDAIVAAEVHIAAHEKRVCKECGARNEGPFVVCPLAGGVEERFRCTVCGHVEVLS